MAVRPLPLVFFAVAVLAAPARAAELDLSRAVVVAPPGLTGPAAKAVRMLVEEIEARTMVRWERADRVAAGGPRVVVGPADRVRPMLAELNAPLPALPTAPEGYAIGTAAKDGPPVVWVAGADARGVLFGVGRLLRELRLDRQRVTLPAALNVTSAPTTTLRGHQIGYRPKTNSYDGWTAAMWEQYVRDLAVFGCNAVELIPPRSDDDADSPLFPAPPLRMMADVSRIAGEYGLDVWVWYPAMDRDYADPKTVAFALREWGEVFRAVPRIDAVFVPGGDPGHTRPKALFDLLEKQTANLRAYHPNAKMWVSPQSFNALWTAEFHELMREPPAWLGGVVFGPQVRDPLPELRRKLPAALPIRDYPDVTHSMRCQYPVPDWDVAFAMTEGREVCNPRPVQTARLFRYGRASTVGFVTYSEGCHDDVNKAVWSALGWDETADVREVLRQYGRYFVSPRLGDRFADGLLALEKNWAGPVLANAGIDDRLARFRAMERDAGPREKLSWRFQQALYRAYYDAYVRARLRHESAALDAATARLRAARTDGSLKAIADAERLLDAAAKEPAGRELRSRLGELAEALFQSVRAQLSVPKYHAIAVGRGANLDSADVPLTDAAWLRSEMTAAKALPDEAARLARLDVALTRTDAGPGGFYDDFGDPARRPHLDGGLGWEKDPGYYYTPLTAFVARGGPPPVAPRAWWRFAQAHYDEPLRATYTGLDRSAGYRVRVVYGPLEGRKVRLTAGADHAVHGPLFRPFEPVEFDVPAAATADGTLTLRWDPEAGSGGAGRGVQVCEVWLLKRPAGR
jgi:hypothetical protein